MLFIAVLFASHLAFGETFSLHLFTEPSLLDPQRTHSSSGSYLIFNLHRGLMRYSDVRGLEPEGATSCEQKPYGWLCRLDFGHRWSNGEPILAEDYVRAFRRLVDPKTASPQSDLLDHVKNAKEILAGTLPPEKLGVSADADKNLRIEMATPDPEFAFKLIQPALAPLPAGGFKDPEFAADQIVSGPYKIQSWHKGQWIDLVKNPFYPGEANRPDVRMFFIDEDMTALRLYQNGKLKFHRRIPTSEMAWAKKQKGFLRVPMARFDYVGFGPDLESDLDFRSALVHGVNFPLFLKLIDTISPPGCPSLPASWLDQVHCQKQNLKQAKTALKKNRSNKIPLSFSYSTMGGDDIARTAAWFQNQWKKNLGVDMELKPEEQGVYLRELKVRAPPIFRKGVNLDRPTCLAAVELFTTGHPDNYIGLKDPHFDQLVAELAHTPTSKKRRACRKAVDYLLSTNRLIPLGEMYFTVLADPNFKGWQLNSLNQLDLGRLAYKPVRP